MRASGFRRSSGGSGGRSAAAATGQSFEYLGLITPDREQWMMIAARALVDSLSCVLTSSLRRSKRSSCNLGSALEVPMQPLTSSVALSIALVLAACNGPPCSPNCGALLEIRAELPSAPSSTLHVTVCDGPYCETVDVRFMAMCSGQPFAICWDEAGFG
jgi:hypothetical protein